MSETEHVTEVRDIGGMTYAYRGPASRAEQYFRDVAGLPYDGPVYTTPEKEQQIEMMLRAFPQLHNPAPPVPLERRNGQWSLSPKECFAQPFKLRAPVEDPTGLVGPFWGHGTCLVPWVGPEGRNQWIDPTMPAQDGDLVVVLLTEREHAGIVERGRKKPEWVATYGMNPGRLATKLLKRCGSDYWCVTNESGFLLGDNKIWGVVRKIDGLAEAHQIQPGAATTVYTDVVSSVGPTSGETNILQIDPTEPGIYEVSVSALLTVSTFSGAGNLLVTLIGTGGGSFTESIWTSYPVTANGQRVEVILKNTYVTTGSGPWSMRFSFADDGTGNQFTGSALSMRVTVIKR